MKLEQIIKSPEINPELKKQLKKLRVMEFVDATLVSNDLAVVASAWHDYSSGGGVARYSILQVFHKGAVVQKRWQYVDKWSCQNDRRERMIIGLGEIKTIQEGNKLQVLIECRPPKDYRMFSEKFTLTLLEEPTAQIQMLSNEDQVVFEKWAEEKKDEVFQELMQVWEKNTHTMPSPHGRLPYEQPVVKELRLNKEAGLGILIYQEQIDFSGVDNPQRQQRALLLRWEDKTTSLLTQKNAYQKEGSPEIQIITFTNEQVIFGTEEGQETVSLKKK